MMINSINSKILMNIFNVVISNYYSVLDNYDDFPDSHTINVCYQVLFNKDLWNIIRSFLSCYSEYSCLSNGDLAAELNCFWYIKEIYKQGKTMKFTEMAMINAVSNGNLDMVKWLCKIGCKRKILRFPSIITNMFLKAIKNNNMKMAEYLEPKIWHSSDNEEQAILSTVIYNNLTMTRWLYKKGYSFTGQTLVHAAINGHLRILEWMYKNKNNIFTRGKIQDAVELAIMHGHTNVVKWFCRKTIYGLDYLQLLYFASALMGKKDIYGNDYWVEESVICLFECTALHDSFLEARLIYWNHRYKFNISKLLDFVDYAVDPEVKEWLCTLMPFYIVGS